MSILIDEKEEIVVLNLASSCSPDKFETRKSILKVNIPKSNTSGEGKKFTKKRKRVKFADGKIEKLVTIINSNPDRNTKTSLNCFKIKIKKSKKETKACACLIY